MNFKEVNLSMIDSNFSLKLMNRPYSLRMELTPKSDGFLISKSITTMSINGTYTLIHTTLSKQNVRLKGSNDLIYLPLWTQLPRLGVK